MRIDSDKLNEMFDKLNVSKDSLYSSLIKMGKKNLRSKEMKDNWSEDNPTYCYCYVVAEMLFWYVCPSDSKPYKLNVPGDPGLHRFIKLVDGTIIDLTAEQFPNYEDVNYENGKVSYFLQTGCKGPSKRAKMLAELMGYETLSREIK